MTSKRRLARKAASKQHIARLATKCPKCRKTCANSEQEAWDLARAQFLRFGGEPAKRVYQCTDGGPWHWTRAEQPPENINTPRDLFYSEDYWLS